MARNQIVEKIRRCQLSYLGTEIVIVMYRRIQGSRQGGTTAEEVGGCGRRRLC